MGWEFDGNEDAFWEYCNQNLHKRSVNVYRNNKFNMNSIVKFGIHKGRSFERVLCGLSNVNDKKKVLEKYLLELFLFLKEKNEIQDIILPVCFFSDNYTRGSLLVNHNNDFFKNLKLSVEDNETENVISLNFNILSEYYNPKDRKFLEKILTSEFLGKLKVGTYSEERHKTKKYNYTLNSLNTFSDYKYIEWASKNIEIFNIDENLLAEKHKTTSLKCFTIYDGELIIDTYYNPLKGYSNFQIHLRPIFNNNLFEFS